MGARDSVGPMGHSGELLVTGWGSRHRLGFRHHIARVGGRALPISSFQLKRVSKLLTAYCEERTPAHIRDQLELRFRFDGNSVVLYERRPHWRRPGEWTEGGVAKFRYFVGRQKWALYCRDQHQRWHRYDLIDESVLFDDLLSEVDDDPTGIFWG